MHRHISPRAWTGRGDSWEALKTCRILVCIHKTCEYVRIENKLDMLIKFRFVTSRGCTAHGRDTPNHAGVITPRSKYFSNTLYTIYVLW